MFKNQLILAISIATGAIIVFGGLILFLNSDIKGKAKEMEYLQSTLGFRLQAADSLVILRKDYSKAQQYIPALDTILPTRDQLFRFPRELTNTAKEEEITLNINLGKETLKTETKLGTIEFTMSGQGIFDNFINFLKNMETGRYSIKLDNLDITRQGENIRVLSRGKVFSF